MSDTDTFKQAGLEAIKRRRGMDAAQRESLNQHFEAQDDLYTQCQQCGARLRGTLAELKAHTCGD